MKHVRFRFSSSRPQKAGEVQIGVDKTGRIFVPPSVLNDIRALGDVGVSCYPDDAVALTFLAANNGGIEVVSPLSADPARQVPCP